MEESKRRESYFENLHKNLVMKDFSEEELIDILKSLEKEESASFDDIVITISLVLGTQIITDDIISIAYDLKLRKNLITINIVNNAVSSNFRYLDSKEKILQKVKKWFIVDDIGFYSFYRSGYSSYSNISIYSLQHVRDFTSSVCLKSLGYRKFNWSDVVMLSISSLKSGYLLTRETISEDTDLNFNTKLLYRLV